MENGNATQARPASSGNNRGKVKDKPSPGSMLSIASRTDPTGVGTSAPKAALLSFRVARALELVETEYRIPQLNLDRISRELGVTKPHFCRLFKREVGIGFPEYVCRMRLRHAEKLLRETALSIKEITAAVGFAYATQLDRAFKAAYGSPPKEFRGRLSNARVKDLSLTRT
jgi:transcriptional regulator GlxA family with amidase domain